VGKQRTSFRRRAIDQRWKELFPDLFKTGAVCCPVLVCLSRKDFPNCHSQTARSDFHHAGGDPLAKNTDIGAINSRMQLDKFVVWSTADYNKAELVNLVAPAEKRYWISPSFLPA